MPARDKEKVLGKIEDVFPDSSEDQGLFEKFLFEDGWSGVSKELSRTDWLTAAIVSTGNWLAVAAARRGQLARALSENPEFDARLMAVLDAAKTGSVVSGAQVNRLKGGGNHIYYGAPGTGKSHSITVAVKKAGSEKFSTTTVFHPDMQNSDFFGTLKPYTENNEIGYRFSPGPFLKAYAQAWNNPEEEVWLVIEELNRAPAAAVFGELFLLLDRKDDGSGQYPVTYPSPECRVWVEMSIEAPDHPDSLKLPSNLQIACTLNSADQGVYPLDTAFRRRWSQHYIPIDEMSGPPGAMVKIVLANGAEQRVVWGGLF